MSVTPKLGIAEFEPSQSQPELVINKSVRSLEIFGQLSVLDKDLTAPPGGPADGDTYIIASPATGAWASQELNIAYYNVSAWLFFEPKDGFRAWVKDEQLFYQYSDVNSPIGWST